MKADGCDVEAVTLDDTVVPMDGSFFHSEVTCRCLRGFNGALSAVVLSLAGPFITLPPAASPHEILRFTLAGSPAADGGCRECTLGLVEIDDCNICHTGQKSQYSAVTLDGESRLLGVEPSVINFCDADFQLGDANDDGKLNIADPVAVLRFLFVEPIEPACREALDATDNGTLDIADGVSLLEYLFRDGETPSPPGPPPARCGPDPGTSEHFLVCTTSSCLDG